MLDFYFIDSNPALFYHAYLLALIYLGQVGQKVQGIVYCGY